MPFIGKNPTAGFATIVKDSFTPNGSDTTFTLSKQVASATDIAVFVGNVRQEPTTAYTVNGTTLDFGSGNAPANGLDMYVLHIAGTHESSVVPADGTISSAKLQSNAVTNAKIANSTLDLTAKVTGALPVANGGTALTSGFLNGGITYGSATDIAGTATTTITGIPSTAKMIRAIWFGITPGNGPYPEWRLGHSSSNITTGYFNHMSYDTHSGNMYVGYNNNANSFRMPGWGNVNNTWYGYFDFVKQVHHSNGNTYWQMSGSVWNSGFASSYAPVNVVGFVNAGSNVVDRYYFGTSNGANATQGSIQVGYI